MARDVLILARDPAFGDALARLLDLALEVESVTTEYEVEAEDTLSESTPVLVVESDGRPEDYAFLLRAWRIRPEAPLVVCCPSERIDAHRAFGPLGVLSSPAAPAPIVRLVRRGLLARPWVQETVTAPLGLPPVLPTRMAPVDVMHMLRRDPLTFNMWREATNPAFHRAGWNVPDSVPTSSYTLARAFLPRAEVDRANFARMSLFGASLREASGAFTNFEGADLRDADLTGALFVGCDFSEADLRGACFDQAEIIACDLRGAYLGAGALRDATVIDCDLDPKAHSAKSPQSA